MKFIEIYEIHKNIMKIFRIWWFMRGFHKNLMKFHKNLMKISWKKWPMEEDFFMTTQNHFFS